MPGEPASEAQAAASEAAEAAAEAERRRARGLKPVLGAFTIGKRASDAGTRDAVKLASGWARFGLAGLVIWALFARQDADRREARDDRRAEREERAARDANLAGAILTLDADIKGLSKAADMEREVCWSVRKMRGATR